jgi:hypothetical protein
MGMPDLDHGHQCESGKGGQENGETRFPDHAAHPLDPSDRICIAWQSWSINPMHLMVSSSYLKVNATVMRIDVIQFIRNV